MPRNTNRIERRTDSILFRIANKRWSALALGATSLALLAAGAMLTRC